MKLSVIVPVYNVEKYLYRCLISLVNQSYENIEILCINDGSTDKSLEVLEYFKSRYPEVIKIYNKKNGGLADTRNYGLKKATGDFIGFVDSDDWVHIDMYKNMIEKMLKTNSDIVICDYTEVYSDKEVYIKDDSEYQLLYESLVCNKLFKRSLFFDKDIQFPVGLWYEDNAVTYKLLFLAKKVYKENRSYYYYRRTRVGSIMNSQKSEKIYDMWEIANNLYKFFSDYEIEKSIQEQIEYIFIRNILFRQIPKIINLEFPNIFKMQKKIEEHFEIVEKYYRNWENNNLIINDSNKYFKNKIGKNHIPKIKGIKVNVFKLPAYLLIKKIQKG